MLIKKRRLVAGVLGALGGIMTQNSAIAQTNTPSSTVAAGTTQLGFNLMGKLAGDDGNLLISPLSIEECAALLYNGARGKTQQDCATVLGLEQLSVDDANSGLADLSGSLHEADPAVQVDIANAIWVDGHDTLDAGYRDRCQRYLGATAQTLDFAKAEKAAAVINHWVDDKTRHNIPTIVDPSNLAAAAMVLTNAVYFHGRWQSPFDKSATKPAPFHTPAGDKQVPMMSKAEEFNYFDDGDVQAVSLPYGSGRFKMIVAMPRAGAPPMDLAWWRGLLGKMRPTEIALQLPRFKATYTNRTLRDTLGSLGLPLHGDYSGTGITPLLVGPVIHKATIDVDEAGTTASAATAIVMRGIPRYEAMTVDRPFFLAIYDSQTGTILFSGVIRDPTQS